MFYIQIASLVTTNWLNAKNNGAETVVSADLHLPAMASTSKIAAPLALSKASTTEK